jgi:hypothetical protein
MPKKSKTSKKGMNPKDKLGLKKVPLRLVPSAAMVYTSAAMALGGLVKGYGPYNWRDNKVLYSVYLEAAMRHLIQSMDGEDADNESLVPHEASIMACCAIILDAKMTGNLVDDRQKTKKLQPLMDEITSLIQKQHDNYKALHNKKRNKSKK